MLSERGRAFRLRVVGDGDDRASLERQVRDLGLDGTVFFEGAVDQDHIRTFYAAADCFCIPSFAEGIPVVLMEAMAMGIPCVSTHITGIPELIQNERSGLLVAPSDVEELVAAIERLMDDPELRNSIGRAARAQVIEHYDLGRNVSELAAIFERQV